MKTRVLVILLIFISTATFGQKKLADKFYKNYAYIKASELYEKAYEKGDDSEHVLTRLGDCYYNNSNTEKAAIWYKRALDKYPKINSEYIYKYIQTQRSLGNYEVAEEWVAKFNALQGEDAKKKYSFGDLALYKKLASTEQVYVEISNLDANSKYSDFGSFEHNGKLYFASSRNAGEAKNYSWNDEPYLDIYQAFVSSEDGKKSLSEVDFIKSEEINTDFHEATVAITKDGKTIYFTRDNVNKRNKLDYDRKGTSHLKIYKASLVNGNWENIKELPFNDDVFSTGHPALSPNEKQLYFVSDRDGGLGQTDIYVVDILEDDKYSEPKNLGATVNSPGKEMFPYIAKDNTLYFSSDGYINLGLLDIFKSDYLKNVDTEPENLGAPFNSGADDFAFFIDSDTKEGYFSSNREGGKGNDDIYSFAAYNCTQTVNGVVLNSETSQPIANATVQKIDATGKIVEEYSTNDKGEYSFEVDCDQEYTILAKKDDHKDDVKELSTTSENKKNHEVNLDLVPLIKDNQIVINPIFFDFDKWNIRTDAEYELESIIDVMREHPNMVIKIEAHTDSRGKDKYNLKLSDRRAKSTKDYLLSRGIAPNRIESAIGYGETQLLNKCSNGVKCTEEEHQVNRRSYFYILNY